MSLVPTSIRLPNDSEVEIISGGIEGLKAMFEGILEGSTDVNPESMDIVFAAWMDGFDDRDEDPDEVQQLVVAFAMAFGNHLAVTNALSWAVAQFADGEEDLTICDPDAQIYLFPISLVSKRFQQRESKFFVSLSNVLGQQVSDLRKTCQSK